jgi:osmoprotectant transport system permease protein
MRIALHGRVRLLLILIAVVACAFTGFVSEAPNRLVSGRPLAIWQVSGAPILGGICVLTAALVASAFLRPRKRVEIAVLVLASGVLLLLAVDAGTSARALMAGARPATRIALGPAFWIAMFCLALIIIGALQRLEARPTACLLVIAALAVPLAALAMNGAFDQLSLLREYAARRSMFDGALLRHVVLVVAAVALALAIGVPLGILVARRPRLDGAIFGALNLLQTIPSIALFGLLIVPLSALAAAVPILGAWGIGGIGAAPAIVALMLYSLLPVARNTEAGLRSIDPAVIDTARAMGFTKAQIFWRVEVPLGMPRLLAGLRTVLVQTIGLTAVAALIGAGGLGTFIFQGIGQYATDLVLLGALPIILLALAADFLVTLAAQLFDRRPSS